MMNKQRINELIDLALEVPDFIYPHDSEEYLNQTINCRKSSMFNSFLNEVLSNSQGDVLEIGALTGTSTKVFCEAAMRFNRTVHVFDPWNGEEAGSESAYQRFLSRTSSYSNLNVTRLSSNSDEAIAKMKEMKIAFCLIDGLHTFDFALKDLLTVSDSITEGGIICLDDINIPDVSKAAKKFLADKGSNWEFVQREGFIESFFCRK
jgi:predicted O-methyltransferase YrrM